MKKVSVLIPTYHSDSTLTRAIDSVLKQSYPNVEVIVVDDNEPEDTFRKSTEALMADYNDDERVKYVKHDHNKNGAAARNTAFRNSVGEYITFLDDDDFYYASKIEAQVNYLEQHPNLGGCYCWRHQNGVDICGMYSGDLTFEILSMKFTPTTPCIMIKRECFETLNGFDESYRRHQDYEFLLRYFKKYELEPVPTVQVEISTNGVNNAPKGQKLIELKEHFFSQFQNEIDEIYLADKRMGEKIYLNHFVRTFKDLLRYGYPKLAFSVYRKYRRKCGHLFLPFFVRLLIAGRYKAITGKNLNIN